MARGGVGAGHAAQSERRRAHLLSLTRQGVPIEKAVAAIPWTWRWYIKQRKQWPDFAAEMDAALAVAYGARGLPPPRQQSYARQHKFLAALRTGLTIGEACAAAGWTSNSSYRQWRVKDADFSAEVDRILDARVGLFGNEVKRDPNTGRIWNPADGFAEFRKRYLHTESPWFHIAAIEAMESMLPGSVLHILWPPEHGKVVGLSELIPTPSGWTTMGELAVGDEVFSVDGTPAHVEYLSPVQTPEAIRLTFSDGGSIVACVDHQWFVRRRDRSWKDRAAGTRGYCTEVVTTAQIAAAVKHQERPNFAIPVADALELPDAELPLDPYVLGAWLGDGTTRAGSITCSRRDWQVAETIERAGFPITRISESGGKCPQPYFRRLVTSLRAAGVFGNKHIPLAYLRASLKQRLALLQGLMDTDGSCSATGQCEFTTTRIELADGIEELIHTLGFKVRRYGGRSKLNGVDHGPKYRISFYPRADVPVFTLQRKCERQLAADTGGDRDRWLTITSAEPAGTIVGRCITVDRNDGLYVAGRDWRVTHNTRLWEDYYTFLLAIDPGARLTIGSEKLAQSKKIVRFVRDRLESTAKGYERLREDWGPFAPMSPKERRELRDIGVDDIAAGSQAWGVEAFDVRKKPKGMESERDPSMQALGMGGSIIGTRCDRLGVDDPQGALTLRKKDSTAQLVETFRQDWLSRPGPTGRTYILANRVGPGDFHEELWENTDIIDRQIALPAWDPAHGGWLWPERYSAVDYRRMRKNAGEGAWERNYMQKGLANKDAAFSDKRIGNCKNNLRSILDPPPRPAAGGEARIIIGLDPGLSKASFHVAALEPHKFWSLDLRLLENARSYGIYGDVLDELCMQFHRPGISVVTHVIVETKAFQGGLLQDDRIIAARRRWSFDLIPFDTGVNKYDPDLGVPQMGPPMDYGEIDFPNKDQVSEDRYSPLYRQLRRWKPLVRGNKLEQDHVMTFWFCVHWWKLWRRTLASNVNPRAFDFAR